MQQSAHPGALHGALHDALHDALPGEALAGAVLSPQELAHACGVTPDWVLDRVQAGVLQVDAASGAWRFDSVTLVRARRIAQLEATFDADPQLAALTTDLIEEVTRLRQRLGASAAGTGDIVAAAESAPPARDG